MISKQHSIAISAVVSISAMIVFSVLQFYIMDLFMGDIGTGGIIKPHEIIFLYVYQAKNWLSKGSNHVNTPKLKDQ